MDGAQHSDQRRPIPSRDHRRAYEPVTEPNPDRPDEVVDADPTADVIVRPDRTLYVAKSRHGAAYHLFGDCDRLNAVPAEQIDVGEMRRIGLPACSVCEKREQVRVAINCGRVPPNPNPTEDTATLRLTGPSTDRSVPDADDVEF
jgi:hypothetical protein